MKNIIFLIIAMFFSLESWTDEIRLKTVLYDSPPYYLRLDGGKIGGIYFDMMKAIEKVSNIRFDYELSLLPQKRAIAEIIQGKHEIMFGAPKIDAFKKVAIYTEPPLLEYNYVPLVKVENSHLYENLGNFLELNKKQIVLVQLGSSAAKIARKLSDIIVDSSAPTVETSLVKLAKKRGSFSISTDVQFLWELRKQKFRDKFKLLPFSFYQVSAHAVFTVNNDGSRAKNELENALKKLHHSGELQRIIDSYTTILASKTQ